MSEPEPNDELINNAISELIDEENVCWIVSTMKSDGVVSHNWFSPGGIPVDDSDNSQLVPDLAVLQAAIVNNYSAHTSEDIETVYDIMRFASGALVGEKHITNEHITTDYPKEDSE